MDLSKLRKEYEEDGIDAANAFDDPIKQFQTWYDQAKEAQIPEPDAAVIASVNEEEYPSSRFVWFGELMKMGSFSIRIIGVIKRLFSLSPKVSFNIRLAALTSTGTRVHGLVEVAEKKESDDYFSQRPRGIKSGHGHPLRSKLFLIAKP